MDFKLFACEEYHSEYRALEVSRLTPLTDKFSLHYYELPKLPQEVGTDDELKLWLALFAAKTEEDIAKIKAMGVPVMAEAIEAYQQTAATNEFREIERLRSRARHNEASALRHATEKERAYWQAREAEKEATHAAELASKDQEISMLLVQLAELRKRPDHAE